MRQLVNRFAGLMYNAGMVRMIEDGKDGTILSHPKHRDDSCISLG